MKTSLTLLALTLTAFVSADRYDYNDSNDGYYYQDQNDGYYRQQNQSRQYQQTYPQRTYQQNDQYYQQPTQYQRRDQYRNQMRNYDSSYNAQQGAYSTDNTMQNPNYTTSNTYSDSQLQNSEKKYPQDSAATLQDRQLNAKIREKLSGGWFSKGYDALILRTANGVVVISGNVDNNDDIQKIRDQIRNIEGVRSVNDQLNVKNR